MARLPIPHANVPLIDQATGLPTVPWYDAIKQIDTLQPLSDIVFPPAGGVTSIDGAAGDFTFGYGITRTALALRASLSSAVAALGADVALNNVGQYFDGPGINLGGVGTWLVTGTVTVIDTGATAAIYCKLWDGTTVLASAAGYSSNLARGVAVPLSGIITNPTGIVRISCRDVDAATGKILFNQTGNSKDSHITAVRIA